MSQEEDGLRLGATLLKLPAQGPLLGGAGEPDLVGGCGTLGAAHQPVPEAHAGSRCPSLLQPAAPFGPGVARG